MHGMISLLVGALVAISAHAKREVRVAGTVVVEIGDKDCNVVDFGAKGDGKSNDTDAFQAALDECSKDGGRVLVPKGGPYLIAALSITGSNVELNLDDEATVLVSNDRDKWPGEVAIITASEVHDVAITGGGVIDGQGMEWWEHRDDFRPRTVYFHSVQNSIVTGVTIKNPPNHCLELYCDNCEVAGVTVLAPPSTGVDKPSHNTDALDVHGSPFHVHDCHFDTGDDNVAMHANDTLVENNYFGNGHGASIGSLCDDWLRNITVRNTVFNGTTSGIRIKTHPKCAGEVKEVVYENLSMTNVETVLTIDMFYEDDGDQKKTSMKIHDVSIRNVTSVGEKYVGYLKCDKDSPCEDIDLQDFKASQSEWNCDSSSSDSSNSCCEEAKGKADNVSPDWPCKSSL